MKKKILVIDDDEKLNSLLKDYLGNFGFAAETVTHPDKGLRKIKSNPPDLIILDVMLPGMDGFETCKEIRKTTAIPIIMLTARGEVTDRIVGLELGADDYLPKPFEPRELVARIQSVLRRGTGPAGEGRIQWGRLAVDPATHSATLDQKPVELTTMEFELLVLFMKYPGKVLTRERIMDDLCGLDWESYDRSIDVLISRLRQKLNDNPKQPVFIRTVWGTGYKFIGGENDA
ncbi:MAG: response regulator transcription factor [bacterium]|nr:response regulator transcription factor [bacterium]